MRLITREQWGAQRGDGRWSRPLPAPEAYLHHSVTTAPDLEWVSTDGDHVDDDEQAAMRHVEDIGAQRFGSKYGFPYTVALMPRGNCAYEGHSVEKWGAHTYEHNDTAVGIVWIGNYEKHRPTDELIEATAWTLVEFKRRGWLQRARLTGGHRDVKATACPGKFAYEAIPEINRRAAALEKGDDDMPSAKEIVDEFLSRDIYELPFKHPENQHLRFKWFQEFVGRHAYNGHKVARQNRAAIRAMAASLPDDVRQAVDDALDDNVTVSGDIDVTIGRGDQA